MRRPLVAALGVAAVVSLGLLGTILGSLPPVRLALPADADGTLRGVLHVHTSRSDGRSTPDEIAAAAARAGLAFVVFTDHGDATRPPDPPTYRSGVLCLDGVEISTTGGHYVALDLPAAPYPLRGDPRDVIEDVARLGGFGIVAHPDSPKAELRWRGWDLPFDAVELINLDTVWRMQASQPGWRPMARLTLAAGTYFFRAPETIASLIEYPDENRSRWEVAAAGRPLVGLAGADVHASLTLWGREPGVQGLALPLPGYEVAFRAASVHIRPAAPPTGDAARDAIALMRGLRQGHVYMAIDGLASPPSFRFTAQTARGDVEQGDSVASGEPLTLHVRSNAPASFTTSIWRNGRIFAAGNQRDLSARADAEPAVYRVEIRASTRLGDRPWLMSNPIYVRAAAGEAPVPSTRLAPQDARGLLDPAGVTGWSVEHEARSHATIEMVSSAGAPPALVFRYRLGPGTVAAPFVAASLPTPESAAGFERLAFSATADRPMRLSIQLRTDGPGGGRWQRSVYLDATERELTVPFGEFTPVDAGQTGTPVLNAVRTVLFVVDTVHGKPLDSGLVTLRQVRFER